MSDFDAGGIIGSVLGYMGTQDTNASRERIADQANAFSAQQFATRYQTTVKDMEAAGLNPMLAYSQGGGSPPTAVQPQIENPMSSGLQAFHQSAERQLMKGQLEKLAEEVNSTKADTALKKAQEEEARSRALLNSANASKAEDDARLAGSNVLKNLIDTVRSGSKMQSEIEKNKQDVEFSKISGKTQLTLAKKYISDIQLNDAGIKNLLAMAGRNTAEGQLASARIKEAVAKGEIATADIVRAQNDMRYEEQFGGIPRQLGRDLSNIGSGRVKLKK